MTARDDLTSLRDECFEELTELISDRPEALKILKRIRSLEEAITTIGPPLELSEYAKYKRVSDAMLAHLDKTGRPVSKEELITALIKGGFRRGEKRLEWIIGQGIDSFISGSGRETKLIKQINGLIGRGEWRKELFKSKEATNSHL